MVSRKGAQPSVLEVFEALWKSRWLIAGVTVAVLVLTGIALVFLPRSYRASATLLVLPAPADNSPDSSKSAERYGVELLQAQLGSFRAILAGRTVAQRVIGELGLDQPPRELDPLDFQRRNIQIMLLREALSLDVDVTLDDAELAARAANRMAEISIDLYRQVRSRQATETREFLSVQLEIAKQQREAAEQAYVKFRSQTQIELLESRVDSLVEQRARLLGLSVQIASVRARVERARLQAAERQPVRVLRQSIMDDSVLREVARTTTGTDSSLLGLAVESEQLDTTYASLEALIAASSAELAALEAERRELVERSGIEGSKAELLTEYYVKMTQLERLKAEFDLARTIQVELAKRDEEARVDAVALYPQVQLIDPAIAPARPSRPRVVLVLAVVGLFTALLTAAGGTLYRLVDTS